LENKKNTINGAYHSRQFPWPVSHVGFILLTLFIFLQCNEKAKTPYENLVAHSPYLYNFATPIKMEPSATVVHLKDYILDYKAIDSISVDAELKLEYLNDSIIEIRGDLKKPAGTLMFYFTDLAHDVLLLASQKSQVMLEYDGEAQDFGIKGDFNSWNKNQTPVKQTDKGYQVTLNLDPGRYQYLFLSGSKEFTDPNNTDSVSNGMGGWNSVIEVPRPDPEKLPLLSTNTATGRKLSVISKNAFEEIIVFWNNYRLGDKHVRRGDLQVDVTIPDEATDVERSHLRVWAYNDEGLSNELLVPLSNGQIIVDHKDLKREDWHSSIMYFMMIDRFYNGNSANDEPVEDPSIHPKANYFGGDLAGITNKINDNYFSGLGFNTLWLSPITQNPKGAYGKYPDPETAFSGYHGYWPVSSSKIDYRFGTPDELHVLLNSAHDAGMNAILDYVANHVHEEHPIYQNYPEWATNLYLEDGTLNTRLWDEQRLTTWFDTFMPTLDLRKPEIVDPLTDSALFWLQNYAFDGFRHDATKHIDLLFWRELTRKIKKNILAKEDRSIYQVGETYGSRELIASYINSGMLDAQFDFNLYSSATEAFGRDDGNLQYLASELKESLSYYGDHHLMVNISGNQDKPRFISLADGSLEWDEDHKLAGWTRKIENKGEIGYKRLAALMAFNYTIPGIPCVYYGDEIGLPGGNDPDNRRMMVFEGLDSLQTVLKGMVAKLASIRSTNLAFIYGTTEVLSADEKTMIIRRKYFDNEGFVFFNTSGKEKSFPLSSISGLDEADLKANFFGVLQEDEQGNKLLRLAPYSFDFLIINP